MNFTHIDLHNFTYQQLFYIGSRLVAGLIVFGFFLIISFGLKFIIIRLGNKFPGDKKPIFNLLGNLSKVGVLLVGTVTAMGSMGVNVNALVASLGLSSFAISFAMKDALSNILAGIMILIYQPFKTGTEIKVGDYSGEVIDIDLRYVTLNHDDTKVLIPNAYLLNQAVVLLKH